MMNAVRKNGGNLFFMCVSDPNAVDNILMNHGLLDSITSEDHLIDMSTVSVECVQNTASKVANFLEAPVSGSKPQAHGGQLVILAAGKNQTFELSKKYFDMMGKNVLFW